MSTRHPSETLDRVAALLDPTDRERFLVVVARFRNIPQDDEYLQVLEAIGFMTLLWKAVPGEILRVMEGADPVQETCASHSNLVRDAVNEAVPSHQDLRLVTQSLREHETMLKTLHRSKPALPRALGQYIAFAMLFGLIILLLLGLISLQLP